MFVIFFTFKINKLNLNLIFKVNLFVGIAVGEITTGKTKAI